MAEEIFHFGGDPENITRNLFLHNYRKMTERENYPQIALEYIIDWIQKNQDKFYKASQPGTNGCNCGVIKEGEYIGILPDIFKDIVKKNDFDVNEIVKAFKERKWFKALKGHYTYPVGFRNKKIRMFKLLWGSFKHIWKV